MQQERTLEATDAAAKSAAYLGVGRETEYRIVGNEGLVLVVQRSGSKSWRFYYSLTVAGKRQKRKVGLGRYPRVTVLQARREAVALLDRVSREGDVVGADAVKAEGAKRTLHAFVDEVLGEQCDLVSTPEKRRELTRDLLPELGDRPPGELRAEDIDRVARKVLDRGAAEMARRLVKHVKALYNFALYDRPALAEKYAIRSNPASTLGRRRGRSSPYQSAQPRTRVLDDREIVALVAAIGRSGISRPVATVILLTLLTAQRHGEVRHMTPGQLDLTVPDPTWTIPTDVTKSKRAPHIVPLVGWARLLVEQAVGKCDLAAGAWIFQDPSNPKDPMPVTTPPMALLNLRRKHLADVPPFTVHDLRRTAATGMRRLGVSKDDVALVLNHARDDVTGVHYDHYDGLSERCRALATWDGHVRQILGPAKVILDFVGR